MKKYRFQSKFLLYINTTDVDFNQKATQGLRSAIHFQIQTVLQQAHIADVPLTLLFRDWWGSHAS